MASLAERIGRSFSDISAWGRNAKALVGTEVLWAVPVSWIFFYRAIFMRNLGMDEVFIGYSMMLPSVLQVLLPFFGGYFADRFGRKRVFLLFDSGWIGSMVVWFMAREPWHMILALVLQGVSTTTFGIWETLLVEDSESQYTAGIYSFLQSIFIFGGLFTPVAGTLIYVYGVDQGCRYVFLIALITITIAFIIRSLYLRESKIGKTLLMHKRDASARPKGYIETSRMVINHRRLLVVLTLTAVGNMIFPLISTYRPLYLSDSRALALDESIISVIPMASSIPSLMILSLVTPRLKQTHMRKALLISYACGIFSSVILITAPKGGLIFAILSSILDSARSVAFFSISRVFLVNTIDEVDPFARAKIMSLVTTYSALASWPAPAIGGYLYAMSPPLPFVLITLLLAVSLSLILKI